MFRAAILVFMAGSVRCAFSGSLSELVAAHVLQGLGGATMSPVGRPVLLRSVPNCAASAIAARRSATPS